MSEQGNNAICSICGKSYYMCSSCKDMMKLEPYKLHTCCAEHFKVYQIIHGLSTGIYDKKETKTKLKRVNLSDFDSFRDNIKEVINKVMKVDEIETDTMVNVEGISVGTEAVETEQSKVKKVVNVKSKRTYNKKK